MTNSSDSAARSATGAPQMLADALLRSLGGAEAQLRITSVNSDSNMSEVGLISTAFSAVVLSPAVIRRMRPPWKDGNQPAWELLVSATSVQQQVSALDLTSAQSLFALTLAVTIAGQDYLIDSVASNEAFGQVYLYRLLLREARQQAV